ncbi:MAG: hypothetical protein ACMG6H_07450, partial [Acidobacteriota bacterium]
ATLALTKGADAYEPKPISAERLIAAVDRLLRQKIAKTASAANSPGGIETNERTLRSTKPGAVRED